ncbi:hypothetical protein ABZ942_15445 [Nocardia sp. NPDC046473]|uniref:hypothetical protein n=1 Tax=Nocardia sp. NPDC046473 TaxID=3155733 RepID=UPI0033FD28DF
MAKSVTFGALTVSVFSFVTLWIAGMPLDQISKIMELSGTAITGIGLVIAWEKSAKRLPAYGQALLNAGHAVRAHIRGPSQPVPKDGSDTFTAVSDATVLKQDGFPPAAIIDEKVYRLLDAVNEIRRDLNRAQHRITDVATEPKLTQQEVDSAVSKALSTFKSDLEIHAVKDLTVAICGVVTTMAGIILSMI